ncbi:hypothetical protein HVPorG_05055 (plasmid) [Roseomonas mucosa]|uniref:hypothetical protein n=1 Tax=Roseomonas mucosa TaxID=207340 RepID=UPI00220C9EE9|nr:hypothetical protein [Roseomonas mucosa]QDJ12279.1 hypothetical protein HVPorG_05055 [Roseomonas mucosa]
MLTPDIERQGCLSSAAQWRQQASHVREHAEREYLWPEQSKALLLEADACDRQADWRFAGADDYALGQTGTGLEALVR